ncbi:MAG: hypothetical protein HDR11_12355 [Lachnospiraceae bacterium]|nr:hypothetical protein [Lachnospiraceae bacterium]
MDDELIEIECSFDRMKKHVEERITIDVRYNIKAEELPFVELKSILILFLEVRKNQMSLIASVNLLDKVRDDKWGLNDFIEEYCRFCKRHK